MISVVIPLYNKEHTIVGTLKSVMCQSYTDFEVVIVNDGSTDGSVDVIERNFSDSRIRIVQQENAGVSAARNRGVDEAKGEYVAFLDGDDEWHPEYLEMVVGAIGKFPQAGMICTGERTASAGSLEGSGYRLVNRYIGKTCIVPFFQNPPTFCHISATTIRKDCFYKAGGFVAGMRYNEDFALTQLAAMECDVVYIGLPLAKYIGGVAGQATSIASSYGDAVVRDQAKYYNLVTAAAKRRGNKEALVYMRYFIRHRIKSLLEEGKPCRGLIALMDDNTKDLFRFGELSLYKSRFHALSIAYINATKLLWRTKGYPYTGEQLDKIESVPQKYSNW